MQHVVDNLDPTMAEAHLLMAQIQVYQGHFLNAQQSLEVCIKAVDSRPT